MTDVIRNTQTSMRCTDEKWAKIFPKGKQYPDGEYNDQTNTTPPKSDQELYTIPKKKSFNFDEIIEMIKEKP